MYQFTFRQLIALMAHLYEGSDPWATATLLAFINGGWVTQNEFCLPNGSKLVRFKGERKFTLKTYSDRDRQYEQFGSKPRPKKTTEEILAAMFKKLDEQHYGKGVVCDYDNVKYGECDQPCHNLNCSKNSN